MEVVCKKYVEENMNSNERNRDQIAFNKVCHDAVAEKYSKTHLDIFNPIEQQRLSLKLSELKNHIPENSMVLDFGCGSGNLTDHLIAFGYEVVSADVSQKFLDIVSARYAGNSNHSTYILKGDLALDLKGMKFNAICMYSVLHHVPNYLECLESLSHLLLPGGLLYIDHEASPEFWNDQPMYTELQGRSRFNKLKLNYKKLFTPDWYLNRFKKIIDPRFQEEGDIHVWRDDHIEWDLVDNTLNGGGLTKIQAEDYLVYQNHYTKRLFYEYHKKVSDMRVCIYKKN